MTTARCPACHAAVPVGAPWCTLCFADLRPKPEPASAEPPVAAAFCSPLPSPELATPARLPEPGHSGPMNASPGVEPLDARVTKQSDVQLAAAAWPCRQCNMAVPIDSDLCPTCGGSFLGGVRPDVTFTLPLVGNVAALGTGQRWALTAVAAAAVTAVLFLVLLLVGSML